ncbi:MAG: hypothetical protein GX786_07380, partial [Clostridiales bacterium]|nr:hypothetical protein [Clostridiales bacterium]
PGIVGHLRNAFAHGHFSIEKDLFGSFVYKIHSIEKKNQYASFRARMMIKETTLLHWIDIISTGKNVLPSFKQVTMYDLFPLS